MRAVTLLKQVFYAIYDRSTLQFYRYHEGRGAYVLGPIDEASRFDTKAVAIAEAQVGVTGPYEIRKCTATWKMSQ